MCKLKDIYQTRHRITVSATKQTVGTVTNGRVKTRASGKLGNRGFTR